MACMDCVATLVLKGIDLTIVVDLFFQGAKKQVEVDWCDLETTESGNHVFLRHSRPKMAQRLLLLASQ